MKSFIENAVIEPDGSITLAADRCDEMVDVYDVENDSQIKTNNNKIAIKKDLNYDVYFFYILNILLYYELF